MDSLEGLESVKKVWKKKFNYQGRGEKDNERNNMAWVYEGKKGEENFKCSIIELEV